MVAEVIKLRSKKQKAALHHDSLPAYWCLNGLFLLDGAWHIWALFTNHVELALVSKFLLAFILAILLRVQLGARLPTSVLIAILFCLAGDVLLQPLDLNYTDMSGDRALHFVLGVVCFCVAYGHLARYLLALIPDLPGELRAQPLVMVVNVVITLVVLTWMTMNNHAPRYLLAVLWVYSPVVVGMATLAGYVRNHVSFLPFLALAAGANVIVLSDTIIGLTVFARLSLPWLANSVWILGTYILGIFLVFNAIISIEKRAEIANS